MADDGMAVLDHLNIDKSHLIAQSMGRYDFTKDGFDK